jgi:hypothetical protein
MATSIAYDIVYGWITSQAVGDDLDYSFDYSAWLLTGDTVSVSTWEIIQGEDAVLTREQLSDNKATVFISCGTANQDYIFRNVITTSEGRVLTSRLTIKCKSF